MRIIRKSSFSSAPWKNGGGVTHEVVREPPGADAFRWRVSVAEIHQGGPFSDFAGYRRFMALLRGAGVRLTCDGRPHAQLLRPGDLTHFDGAADTSCTLLDGPCVDLNLIVSQSIQGARAWTEPLTAPRSLSPGRGIMLVFVVAGSASMHGAAGGACVLGEWDFAVAAAADAAVLSPAGRRSEAEPVPLVFLAALDDNSVQIT
jgi:hypothetical protein